MKPLDPGFPFRRVTARLRRDDGVEAIELALAGMLIVIALLAAFPPFADAVGSTFEAATTVMQSVVPEGAD
jgi:Flp pilus assembly pilin Flp